LRKWLSSVSCSSLRGRLALLWFVPLLFGFAAGAWAEDAADPPGRVGRLSLIEGKVSFHDSEQEQWTPATLNWPVTSGQSFWVEPGSRAEIQIGDAALRLDEGSELEIVRLDDNSIVLKLPFGAINVHLNRPSGEVEVETARTQVSLRGAGRFRVSAGRPGEGGSGEADSIAVFDGEAKIDDPRAPDVLRKGEAATLGAGPDQFTLGQAQTTPLDDWALARERSPLPTQSVAATPLPLPAAPPTSVPPQAAGSIPSAPPGPVSSAPPVSPDMTGQQDLAGYGSWATAPAYGAVWYPRAVPAGWAPYRYGHWAFVRPWGWTWIDDAPWGFAPFHYGRWVAIDGVWAWIPGRPVIRPVYAPALVAFIGGPRWSVSLTGFEPMGAVGWVPLAPFEVYRPVYRTSVAYVRRVNITNVNETIVNRITNVTVVNGGSVARFTNRQAATVVPGSAFSGGAAVHRTQLNLPREQVAEARVTSNIGHLQPSAAARTGQSTPHDQLKVPEANASATVVRGRNVSNAQPQPPRSQGQSGRTPAQRPDPAQRANPAQRPGPAQHAAAPNGSGSPVQPPESQRGRARETGRTGQAPASAAALQPQTGTAPAPRPPQPFQARRAPQQDPARHQPQPQSGQPQSGQHQGSQARGNKPHQPEKEQKPKG
jgi:hypothetical protein